MHTQFHFQHTVNPFFVVVCHAEPVHSACYPMWLRQPATEAYLLGAWAGSQGELRDWPPRVEAVRSCYDCWQMCGVTCDRYDCWQICGVTWDRYDWSWSQNVSLEYGCYFSTREVVASLERYDLVSTAEQHQVMAR